MDVTLCCLPVCGHNSQTYLSQAAACAWHPKCAPTRDHLHCSPSTMAMHCGPERNTRRRLLTIIHWYGKMQIYRFLVLPSPGLGILTHCMLANLKTGKQWLLKVQNRLLVYPQPTVGFVWRPGAWPVQARKYKVAQVSYDCSFISAQGTL